MQKPLIPSRRHRVVLVDQSAEDVRPLDPVRQSGRKLHRTVGDRQIEPSVRSLLVVVPLVAAEDPVEISPSDQERLVEHLAADRPHSPLSEGVRPRGTFTTCPMEGLMAPDRSTESVDEVRGRFS